jgi:hypothetical protein
MFLIPIVFVGFNIWEKQKKAEEEKKMNGPQAPEAVDGPLFEVTSEDLVLVHSESTTDSTSLYLAESSISDASSTSSTPRNELEEGPFHGIRKFFAQKRENDPFRIKTRDDQLKFEVLGNQGDLALNFPKISFK